MTEQTTPGGSLEDLIVRVNAASVGAIDTNDVQGRLGAGNEDRASAPAAIDMALTYYENHGDRGSDYFRPMFESDDFAYPARPCGDASRDHRCVGNGRQWCRPRPSCSLDFTTCASSSDTATSGRTLASPSRHTWSWRSATRVRPKIQAQVLHVAVNATHYIGRALDLARLIRDDVLAVRVDMEAGVCTGRAGHWTTRRRSLGVVPGTHGTTRGGSRVPGRGRRSARRGAREVPR